MWVKEHFEIFKFFQSSIATIFNFSNKFNYEFAFQFPFLIFLPFLYFFSLISNRKKIYKIFISLIILKLCVYFFNTNEFVKLITYLKLPKNFSYTYFSTYFIFFYCLILILILNQIIKFKKILITILILTIISFQINSSVIPWLRQNTEKYKEEYYRDYYTFDGYYAPKQYQNIKKIVKNDRIVSIGFDPMAAIVNDIKTIDGYHNLYPLSYKIKFKEVINDELNNGKIWKDYYNNWGSRVYAVTSDPKNIKINFLAAKKLGAAYVLSKYQIKSKNLKAICENCNRDSFYLYKII